MFEAKHIQNKTSNYIEVRHPEKRFYAKIDLDLGGSLQELVVDGATIMESKRTLPYDVSYASAILFPFANRIENGKYTFNGKHYQLEINKPEEHNALHGLVHNKTFEVVAIACHTHEAEVHVRYIGKGDSMGFPFKYILTASYRFRANVAKLIVEVKNIDGSPFPFTMGWHPYFVSGNLAESVLEMDCSKRIMVNEQRIPTQEAPVDFPKRMQIQNQEWDDCFVLDSRNVSFETPDYAVDFRFSKEPYVQLYIPPNRKTMAIEPQSGAANNFNNHRGLKVLQPQEHYETQWTITVKTTAN